MKSFYVQFFAVKTSFLCFTPLLPFTPKAKSVYNKKIPYIITVGLPFRPHISGV